MTGAKTVLSLNLIQHTKISGGRVLHGLLALKKALGECVAMPGVPALIGLSHNFIVVWLSTPTDKRGLRVGAGVPSGSLSRAVGLRGGGHQFKVDQERHTTPRTAFDYLESLQPESVKMLL